MKATIYDLQTDTVSYINDEIPEDAYMWGNWSCDCNRDVEGVLEDSCYCHGEKRFIVVDAQFHPEDGVCTLQELNSDYDPELVATALERYGAWKASRLEYCKNQVDNFRWDARYVPICLLVIACCLLGLSLWESDRWSSIMFGILSFVASVGGVALKFFLIEGLSFYEGLVKKYSA